MSHILIAHAPDEQNRAALVAEKLVGLGYEVRQDGDGYRALSPIQRRKLNASVAEAACVVVLWSREAAGTPALQAAALAAKAQGKLALARLDASSPPNRMSAPDIANLTQWQGLDEARGWRELVDAVTAKTKPAAKKAAAAPQRASAPAAKAAPAKTPDDKKPAPVLWIGLILFVFAAIGVGGYAYVAMNHLTP